MQITEPATLLTDYLMAALALAWFWRLAAGRGLTALDDWRRVFGWLALSSFLGGTFHGFQAMLTVPVLEALWRSTMASAALASLFLLRAGAGQFSAAGWSGWRHLALLKALIALVTGQIWPVFLVVLVDSGISLLLVGVLALRGWDRAWDARAMFLAGLGLFVVGGTVQAVGFAPHPAFNHNDLFHVIQILGNWMFYQCARETLAATRGR